MDPNKETQKAGLSNKVVILVAAVIVAIAMIVTAAVFFNSNKDDGLGIGYAADATVMLDQDSLQAAMDEAMANAANNNVALKYQNNAYSEDGQTFECLIANSERNAYDMFLTIFADAELTDQIFLSQLVPPGSGFESITLDRALDPGDHTVFVAVTQVDTDETGAQIITNQVVHTMEFHVTQ